MGIQLDSHGYRDKWATHTGIEKSGYNKCNTLDTLSAPAESGPIMTKSTSVVFGTETRTLFSQGILIRKD